MPGFLRVEATLAGGGGPSGLPVRDGAPSTVVSSANGTSSPALSHTIGGGANRFIAVIAATDAGSAAPDHGVTGVTFGGVALTKAVEAIESQRSRTSIWYGFGAGLPAAGSHAVAGTGSGSLSWALAVVSYSNAYQGAPPATQPANLASATAISLTLAGVPAASVVLDAASRASTGRTYTEGAGGARKIAELNANDTSLGAGELFPAAGGLALGWSVNGTAGRMTMAAMAIPGAA